MTNCLFIGNQKEDFKIFKCALEDVFVDSCCYTSANGMEALTLMDNYDIVPDFIFVELEGSGVDTFWFLHAVRKLEVTKGVPVIVHASVPHPEKVKTLKDCGATAIYFKPYDYYGVCNVLTLYIGSEYANYQLN